MGPRRLGWHGTGMHASALAWGQGLNAGVVASMLVGASGLLWRRRGELEGRPPSPIGRQSECDPGQRPGSRLAWRLGAVAGLYWSAQEKLRAEEKLDHSA